MINNVKTIIINNMEKTPIQKAIDCVVIQRKTIMKAGELLQANVISVEQNLEFVIRQLESLLPYEKQFMQGVFERGSEREVKPGQAFLPESPPDFETLYSTLNQ